MKKIIISEEEKSRILGMHQETTKRYYLGEQSMPKVSDKTGNFRNLVAKAEQFLPIDGKMVKTILDKLKDEDTPVNEIIQPFDTADGQRLIQKINPKGYNMATNSEWEQYESITTGGKTNSHRSTWEYALADILNVKSGLLAKAQEISTGRSAQYPSWVSKKPSVLDYFAKQAGLIS